MPKAQSVKYVEIDSYGILAEVLDGDISMSVPVKRLSWHPQLSKSSGMRVSSAGKLPPCFMVTQEAQEVFCGLFFPLGCLAFLS